MANLSQSGLSDYRMFTHNSVTKMHRAIFYVLKPFLEKKSNSASYLTVKIHTEYSNYMQPDRNSHLRFLVGEKNEVNRLFSKAHKKDFLQ